MAATIKCNCCGAPGVATTDLEVPEHWSITFGTNGIPYRVCAACVAARPKDDDGAEGLVLDLQPMK